MAFHHGKTNEVLEKQHYSFKGVRACTDLLAKSKCFTTIGPIAAFWQTPLHPDSQACTAVNIENGK